MGIEARVQSHKAKIKKETKDDNFRGLRKPGTPEGHKSMTSHFSAIKKCGKKVSKKGDVDYDKQTDSIKKPYKKKRGNMNS